MRRSSLRRPPHHPRPMSTSGLSSSEHATTAGHSPTSIEGMCIACMRLPTSAAVRRKWPRMSRRRPSSGALRGMPTFEWRSGGFGAWLFRIAANELTNHYRRQGRTASDKAQRAFRMYVSEAVSGGEFDRIETKGSADAVREAMTTLNDRYQQVIALRFLSGLSHDDAARAMGMSKPVMAVTLHRAVAALRKAVEERGGRDGDQV